MPAALNTTMRYRDILVEYGFVRPEVTNSPAFKAWFGNSRVRRRDGSPAVVYHGTGSEVPSFRGMVWATHNPRLANDYAEFRGSTGGNPNVIPLFMRIEHPLNAERLPRTVTVSSFFTEVFKQAHNRSAIRKAKALLPIIEECRREEESGPHYSPHDFWFETSDKFGRRGSEVIFAIYKMLGFDGIRDWENSSDTWGAFSPLQVKSAFNSTFDASSSHLSEADSESDPSDMSKEEIRAAAGEVMKRMGVTPVVHWYEGGDDDYGEGMHIPGTGVMYLNSRRLSSIAHARGVAAHESMHHKFSRALEQYEAEKQAGTKGPAHAALWRFLEGPDRDKLRRARGVSSYSQKAWRQAELRPDLLGAERRAHDETLAEMARLEEAPETVQGAMKIQPIWQRYFSAVNRLYQAIS